MVGCTYVCANKFLVTNNDPLSEEKKWSVSARGVMVIFVGNGHGDSSSNPVYITGAQIAIF